jgi:hypothetical protein
MTHRPIRTLSDGTRVYAAGQRYTPRSPEERVYAVRKPDDPRAVRWRGDWLLPLEVIPLERRVLPQTRPDDQTLEHRASCVCEVCRRPEARKYWRMARKKVR